MPLDRNVSPAAQMIVTINRNVLVSKPNLICIRPPMSVLAIGPPGVRRFEYRLAFDCFPVMQSGDPGDVTSRLGLSPLSYVSKIKEFAESATNRLL